ncbi:hypothetical protein [Flavobacterium sp.]|uniref:hypothetical protein n=1 Tax=Flavobacterium sp. TaxID=239 RepID=UPI003D6A5EC4
MEQTTIKELLGFSQEEISIVLGITRSQWAMYEIGKRDLPLKAKKELTAILLHLQEIKETFEIEQKYSASEQLKIKKWLEQEYHKVEYKKQVITKKKDRIENKRAGCFAALKTIHFLENQMGDTHTAILNVIKKRVSATLNRYPLHELEDLKMQEEHFEMLRNRLELKIANNLKIIENKFI